MGTLSIRLLRGGTALQLHGSSLSNIDSDLVGFLYHCHGLSANSRPQASIILSICRGGKDETTCVRRRRVLDKRPLGPVRPLCGMDFAVKSKLLKIIKYMRYLETRWDEESPIKNADASFDILKVAL